MARLATREPAAPNGRRRPLLHDVPLGRGLRDPAARALRDRACRQPHPRLRLADSAARSDVRGDDRGHRDRPRPRVGLGGRERHGGRRAPLPATPDPHAGRGRSAFRPCPLRRACGGWPDSSRSCAPVVRHPRRSSRCCASWWAEWERAWRGLRFSLPENRYDIDTRGTPRARPAARGPRTSADRAGRPARGARAVRPARVERPLLGSVTEARRARDRDGRLHVEVRRQLAEVEDSRARIVTAGNEERAGSSVTCTTAPSSGWSRSAWRCATRRSSSRRRPRRAHADARRAVGELASRSRSCASWPAACRRPSSTTVWRRPCASWPARARARARCGDRGALRPDVETAAYFVGSEALANAAKHARATRSLRAARRNGSLVVRSRTTASAVPAPSTAPGSPAHRPRGRARRTREIVSPPGHDPHRGASVRVVIAEDQALLREGSPGCSRTRDTRWSRSVGDAEGLRAAIAGTSPTGGHRRPDAADLHRRGRARRAASRPASRAGRAGALPARRGSRGGRARAAAVSATC